jgi:caa(3)-type oxidase subunit IV
MSDNNFKDSAPHHHVMPLKIYFGVFGALIVLTGITVLVSQLELGIFALYVAMAVALVKAGFVVGYFMHLKFDEKFHQLIFFGSLFFLVVFFVFTFLDLSNRALINPEAANKSLRQDQVTAKLVAYRADQLERDKALREAFKRPVKASAIKEAAAIYKKRTR